MRPRVNSAVLVAKSGEKPIVNTENHVIPAKGRPYVKIYGRKLYINPNEENFYLENGFLIFRDK